jgi:hypothetical protein
MEPETEKQEPPRQEHFARLIAKALGRVEAEELRSIVGSMLRDHLMHSYDCKAIVMAAVDPVIKAVIREVLQEPEMQEALVARARAEVLRLSGRITLSVDSRY